MGCHITAYLICKTLLLIRIPLYLAMVVKQGGELLANKLDQLNVGMEVSLYSTKSITHLIRDWSSWEGEWNLVKHLSVTRSPQKAALSGPSDTNSIDYGLRKGAQNTA